VLPAARGRVLAVDATGYPFNDYARMRRLGYPQLGALWGVEAVGGYEPIANARYHRLVGGISPSGVLPDGSVFAPGQHALDVLDCREARFDPAAPLPRPAWPTADGRLLNPRAPGAAWRVPRAQVGEVDRHMTADPDFDPRATALLDEGPAPAGLTPGSATLRWQGFDHLALETDGAGPGLVVASVGYDPGWRAFAGGQELPVHRVDGLVLGVEVPAGRQAVALAYEPPRWRAGLGLSLASLLLGLVWARRRAP
jgi:hypothetical protein